MIIELANLSTDSIRMSNAVEPVKGESIYTETRRTHTKPKLDDENKE